MHHFLFWVKNGSRACDPYMKYKSRKYLADHLKSNKC